MSELPQGWARATLGELVTLNPRSHDIQPADEDPVSFIPMASVEEEAGKFDASSTRPFGEVSKGYTRFQDGDVIFAKITPCMENGKSAALRGLVGGRGAGSTEFHVLRPLQGVSSELLFYFLVQKDVRRAAKSKMKGAAGQLRVPPEFIAALPFNLPPSHEQGRIVAEIEALLTDLDAAVAALKRVQANLKRYRASVLKAACEGRLVPTEAELARKEGRSYETGEQLLARVLKERRVKWEADQLAKMLAAGKPPNNDDWKKKYKEPAPPDTTDLHDLAEGWAWASVEQLNPAERPCAYGVLQPGQDIDNGVLFVRVGDIDDGYISETQLKRISPKIASEYPRTKLRGGEVLITLVGAIGRTAVVPPSLAGANTARAVGVLPISSPEISSRWVELWFRNPTKVAEMTGRAHEVARMTLNLEDVRAAAVALPPRIEQHRIVEEAEKMLTTVKACDNAVDRQLLRADRLRQAILKRAFEGTLLPQDPNDEPAAVLLERIRAERAIEANGNRTMNQNGRRARRRAGAVAK